MSNIAPVAPSFVGQTSSGQGREGRKITRYFSPQSSDHYNILSIGGEEIEFRDLRPITDVLAAIAADIPPEELAKLPPDFTDHIDHYLYGTPKR